MQLEVEQSRVPIFLALGGPRGRAGLKGAGAASQRPEPASRGDRGPHSRRRFPPESRIWGRSAESAMSCGGGNALQKRRGMRYFSFLNVQ